MLAVSFVKAFAWKLHVISGAGKPSAEQDNPTAVLINAATFCGLVINRGATKQNDGKYTCSCDVSSKIGLTIYCYASSTVTSCVIDNAFIQSSISSTNSSDAKNVCISLN